MQSVSPAPTAASNAVDQALVAIAEASAKAEVGKPVSFRNTEVHRQGDWAFLQATMRDASGHALSYKGTPLAEAEREGTVSDIYAGLFQQRDGHWVKVEEVVGPTDVAWAGWGEKHKLDNAMFGLPKE